MADAHSVFVTQVYKHTPKISDTYWFSTKTVVTRTRFDVTLYLHRLSCFDVALILKFAFQQSVGLHNDERAGVHDLCQSRIWTADH